MTFNIHQLLHLVQSVADLGPLWAHHGYPFEDGNGQLVKTVKSAKGVLHQICRSINFKRCITVIYFGKSHKVDIWVSKLSLLEEFSESFVRMVKNECLFSSTVRKRTDDSFAQTKNGMFIKIEEFIIDSLEKKEYTLCKQINTIDLKNELDLQDFPCLDTSKTYEISTSEINETEKSSKDDLLSGFEARQSQFLIETEDSSLLFATESIIDSVVQNSQTSEILMNYKLDDPKKKPVMTF
ncbi:hypothetical protein TKK_0013746 [Trichogramma kaykai]